LILRRTAAIEISHLSVDGDTFQSSLPSILFFQGHFVLMAFFEGVLSRWNVMSQHFQLA